MNRYLQAGMRLKKPECPGEYEIKEIVGTGASCVVYYAEFVDASGVHTEHLLKEYNPRGLKLERDETGCLHLCSESDASAFEAGLCRFKAGYEMQLNVRRSSHTKNSTSNIQGVFDSNGTRYIDMTVMAGMTYEKVEEETLYNLLKRIEAITKVVGSYHESGLLHLDIKPDNIFVLPETVEMVQMFDFDSVIQKSDVASSAFLSYTQSWAAQEQILPNRRNRICEATDIFAIGEILFYKLMGRHSEAHERRSFATFNFDYSKELFEGVNPRVFPLLSEIFKHTICNVVTNRYQSTSELLEVLTQAVLLADPHEPFLQHHLPSKAAYFVGRDVELQEIEKRLIQNDKLFISGMGGMGKSELVRQYAHAHKEEYDAVIFSVCNTDLESMILDDSLLPICHVRRGDKKDRDYLKEKYSILKRLCNKRVLIIVDNFNDLQDNTLSKLLQLNCKMLFTTRCDVSEYNYEQLSLGVLGRDYVWDIFHTWYKAKLSNEDRIAVEQILNLYQGHTMAVELIAKQMRASNMTPRQMLDKLHAGGFSDSGRESVVHAKDGMNAKMNIHSHIRRLFDVAELSEDQVYVLANLSLIPPSGIAKRQFHDWCRLDTYEDINELIESGWIRQDEGSELVFLHPVIADVMLDELEHQFELCRPLLMTIAGFLNKGKPDNEPDSIYGAMPSTRFERLIPIVQNILNIIIRFKNIPKTGILFIITVASELHEFGGSALYLEVVEKAIAVQQKRPVQEYMMTIKLLNIRGMLLSANCDYQLAEISYKQALELAISYCGESDTKTLTIGRNLISTYRKWGKDDKVKEYYLQMRSVFSNESNRIFSASEHTDMGLDAKKLGYYSDAEYFYQKALWQRIEEYGLNHGLTGLAHMNLGALYSLLDNYEKAEEHLEQARISLRDYYGERHSSTATAYAHSGNLALKRGRYEQAEWCFQKVLRIRLELHGKRHLDTAMAFADLAAVMWKQNKWDLAYQYYQEAIVISREILGANHISLSPLLRHLGSMQMERGDLAAAKSNLLAAEIIEADYYDASEPHPDVALTKNALGLLFKAQGAYDEAIRYCSEALNIWQHIYGNTHTHTALARLNLGVLYRECNRYQEAITELEEALQILVQVQGVNSLDVASVHSALGKTYFELGKMTIAEKEYQIAFEIRKTLLPPDHSLVKQICQRIQELHDNVE